MDRLKIIFREQMERAKELVVLEIERPGSLEVATEREHGWRLYDELLRCACLTELLVVLRCREPGRPPRSAAMVVVCMGVEVRCMVVMSVAEELRHDHGLRRGRLTVDEMKGPSKVGSVDEAW